MVGPGSALLSRDYEDDEGSDLGFVNGLWWGSVMLDEAPSSALAERIRQESRVWVGEWRHAGYPEIHLAVVLFGSDCQHLLLSEAGPWIVTEEEFETT